MKDVFWKIFAIAALFVILVSLFIFANSNRYAVQNKYFILDKLTGKTFMIKSKYYRNLDKRPKERNEVDYYIEKLSPKEKSEWDSSWD